MKIPRFQLLILVFLGIGLYFRINNLGGMLYSHDEAYTSLHTSGFTGSEAIDGIWIGEVITREDIQTFLKPRRERGVIITLDALVKSQPHESPLYFLLAHYWKNLVGSTPTEMRGLSVLFSLLTILAMVWLCKELFQSSTTLLLSILFLVLSPYNILFAQDARPYSLWALMTIVSTAVLLAALRLNMLTVWGGYTLSLAIGFYSHQLFTLVAIAHGCYVLANKELRINKRYSNFLISSIFALLLITPWLVIILTRWNQVVRGLDWASMYIPPTQYVQRWILIFASPFLDLQFETKLFFPYLLRGLVLLLYGSAIYFLIQSTSRRIWLCLLLIIMITTVPFIFSDLLRGQIVSTQGRYYIPANTIIIPIVAHLFSEKVPLNKAARSVKWMLILALLITGQVCSAFNIKSAKTWWNKNLSTNNPKVVEVLNQASNPLFVIYGIAPTDLGDVLALSYMVDNDVQFELYQKNQKIDFSGNYSDVYWFHCNYSMVSENGDGNNYSVSEVVPGRLCHIEVTKGISRKVITVPNFSTR